jgi:hypothetical protein
VANLRITKRVVDGLKPRASEFAVWDAKLPGFGVRVRPSGAMSYVVVYRAGSGRGAPVRRFTIASVGKTAPEAARTRAKAILGAVAHGRCRSSASCWAIPKRQRHSDTLTSMPIHSAECRKRSAVRSRPPYMESGVEKSFS